MALLKPAGMALDTNILAECILQELKAKGSERHGCSSDTETRSPSSSTTPRSEEPASPSRVPLHLANLLASRPPCPPPGLVESPQEAQWQVMNPGAKFKSSCGCSLVSHPISVGQLQDVRVIFSPGKLWMSAYCRNTKKHKKTQVTEALPKHGSLQLKLTESAPACRVFFVLGGLRVGPLVTSPGQVTSEVCELDGDWRVEAQKFQNQLPIRVEMEA